ncbi:hypothetical protein GCM10022223_07180 [Kineosporia mesophila]|uniref:Chlorophyllase n=1 Tax=Kineosporia mesophila TaxID=566012 RepID=A0ABP6Z0W5_9ACTN|nr:chlorophyllase [Kineosporia mesophila]MCD5351097.1 chlorophyllase [Kineosporia mesophila]
MSETLDVGAPTPTISVKPVVLPAPERGTDLQVRVSAPTTGENLPVIVFSHGFGKSLDAYAPLADFWASHGFVVIQPTHLDSHTLGLTPEDPRYADIWRFRNRDLTRVLDEIEVLTSSVPGLASRIDRDRIAVAGHSWGATTASMLIGARVVGDAEDVADDRVKATVLLALAGTGGEDLTPFAAQNFAFMSPDFSGMTPPALLVAGDADQSPLSVRGPEWFTDGFHLAPGEKHLLTLFGAEHSLGGITGSGVTETTDENPERVALIQQVTVAYLRSALGIDPTAWDAARDTLKDGASQVGSLVTKG